VIREPSPLDPLVLRPVGADRIGASPDLPRGLGGGGAPGVLDVREVAVEPHSSAFVVAPPQDLVVLRNFLRQGLRRGGCVAYGFFHLSTKSVPRAYRVCIRRLKGVGDFFSRANLRAGAAEKATAGSKRPASNRCGFPSGKDSLAPSARHHEVSLRVAVVGAFRSGERIYPQILRSVASARIPLERAPDGPFA